VSSEPSTLKPKWKQRTPEQRVGRRAILRFEELTDELERDLRDITAAEGNSNNLPDFAVSFVSVDRLLELDCSEGHECTRYYNLRLIKTYRLTDPEKPDYEDKIAPAFHWIRKNKKLFRPLFDCADLLEKHSHNHFDKLCHALDSIDSLLNDTNQPKSDAERPQYEREAARIHDLLAEAIAAMPYKGLLPKALDDIFYFGSDWQRPVPGAARFRLKFEDSKVWSADSDRHRDEESAVTLLKQADELIPIEPFLQEWGEEKTREDTTALGELYIDQFINWFTLGITPDKTGADRKSPYQSVVKDLDGLALPAYHFHTKNGQPVGGFEGWLVLIVRPETNDEDLHRLSQKLTSNGRSAFMLACRSFSRRVREERMRELVEKEWTAHTTDLRSFTLAHFPEYDGWLAEKEQEPTTSIPQIEEHWLFAFLRMDGGQFLVYDKPPDPATTADSQDKTAVFHDSSDVTHVAVWPPSRNGHTPSHDTPPLIFRKRDDTILPKTDSNEGHDNLVAYGFHITQSVHQIYEAARIKELALRHERLLGRSAEKKYQFFATSHELKDLTRLIPKAESKKYILEALRDSFLTFSLPAASKLDEDKDKPHFPPAVYGFRTTKTNSHGEQPCVDYRDWLSELVSLAAKMQAIAIPGIRGRMADSPEKLADWQDAIAQKFNVSDGFSGHPLPQQFATRCFLAVAILCALRNVIKHSVGFDVVRNKNTGQVMEERWSLLAGDKVRIAPYCEEGSWLIEITNSHSGMSPGEGNDADGTQAAIAFYLGQIQEGLGHSNLRRDEDYCCLMPMLE